MEPCSATWFERRQAVPKRPPGSAPDWEPGIGTLRSRCEGLWDRRLEKRRQVLTAIRIHQDLCVHLGFAGVYSSGRRCVRQLTGVQRDAVSAAGDSYRVRDAGGLWDRSEQARKNRIHGLPPAVASGAHEACVKTLHKGLLFAFRGVVYVIRLEQADTTTGIPVGKPGTTDGGRQFDTRRKARRLWKRDDGLGWQQH